MNKQQAIDLLPAIKHFSEGKNLWHHDDDIWMQQSEVLIKPLDGCPCNIIEDKHFEARKHFALGGEIESQHIDYETTIMPSFEIDLNPMWLSYKTYRPKVKLEWYNDERNFGKPIMVNDNELSFLNASTFEYCFNLRPLTLEEITMEGYEDA